MKKYKSLEELRENHRDMFRYEHEIIEFKGKLVILTGTCEAYEDELWGKFREAFESINDNFGQTLIQMGLSTLDSDDLASRFRDKALDILFEEYGIQFIELYDEF